MSVMFIPGNHDELLRCTRWYFFRRVFLLHNEHIHTLADGRRFLLIHGDQFDQVTRHHRWLAVLGDVGYDGLVRLNGVLAGVRRVLRRPGYWSLAGYAKNRVKRAVSFIFDFEDSVIHAVRERGLDGVILRSHPYSAATRPWRCRVCQLRRLGR
ncbi:MAG: hypothetical protein IPJ25_04085 [Rhodocyclaceae bacterium]|nr:hypothetical protein [Rhodocyclaceae bacterium]